MANGRDFSFKYTDISEYGLHYAPERNDWHIWGNDFKVIEKIVDSRDGGQHYGSTVQPKQFSLRCYFEEITEYQLAMVYSLFKKDAYGPLVFDERPWLTYTATVTKPPEIVKYPAHNGTYSGTVVFGMTAYNPFGYSTEHYTDSLSMDSRVLEKIDQFMATTGIVSMATAPVNSTISDTSPATAQFKHYYLNGGDAPAQTTITIAGDVGTGIDIYNYATKQTCRVIGLTDANTTNIGEALTINSQDGSCYMWMSGSNGYRYHDKGYIQMAPNVPIYRNVGFYYDGEGNITSDSGPLSPLMENKHIYIDGGWRQIVGVFINTAWIDIFGGTPGNYVSDIITLNPIIVTPVTTMNLTMFDVSYSHTFY